MRRRNSLAEIDRRLAAVEAVAAHSSLIEQTIARTIALSMEQFQNRIDQVVLAANLQSVANAIAQRLQFVEQRLDQVAQQIALGSRKT